MAAGIPLRAINLLKAARKESVDMFVTISRWIPLVAAHVKRAIQTFLVSDCVVSLMKSGPAKSMPVWVNGGDSWHRKSGKGAMICCIGFLLAFWQVTQRKSSFLTVCPPLSIQYFSRRILRV